MKPIRSLFLLAIGMMVCTVHATTCAPEQKQKTTFSTEHTVQFNAVNVDYPEVAVLTAISNTYVSAFYAPSFETKTFNLVTFAVDDVGWCESIKFTNCNQLNIISCHKKLEQNLFANRSLISQVQKLQSLELYMEHQRKMLILPNLHLTDQLKLASQTMRLHQMYLYQGKIII